MVKGQTTDFFRKASAREASPAPSPIEIDIDESENDLMDDLDQEANLLTAHDQVPLASIRRFATRSSRFADSYFNGLSGAEAAWVCKKYRGHGMLPRSFKADLEAALKANTIGFGV